MPIIRAKPNNWAELFGDLLPLWLDPTSTRISRATWVDMQGHTLHALRKKFPEKVKFTEREHCLVYGADPRGVRLQSTIQSSLGQGMMAGAILFTVLRLADHSIEPASVEAAIRLLGPDFEKSGLAGGRASFMKAWSRYKGLSHFFAAAIYRPAAFKKISELLKLRVSKKDIARAEDPVLPVTAKNIGTMLNDVPAFAAGYRKVNSEIAPQFFATAERFRELGETHYAPGQRKRGKPLLDKEIMWRIPRGFKLPHVKITFRRLSKAERTTLSSMSKSKR